MECATCLADLYPPDLIANPEFDPEDTLPPLYDRYVLLPTDNEEVVVNFLVELHSVHLEQWAKRDQERRLSGETRFADEDPKPEFPLIIKRSSRPQRESAATAMGCMRWVEIVSLGNVARSTRSTR